MSLDRNTEEYRNALAIFRANQDDAIHHAITASPRLKASVERLYWRCNHEMWSYSRYLIELNRLVSEN